MSGAGNALYGFRFQVLRTVERVLELYQSDPAGEWSVEIESATEEKVDYAEWRRGVLTRAVQVKASMPESTTRMGAGAVQKILDDLAAKFPQADEVAVEGNREGNWTWIESLSNQVQDGGGPQRVAWYDPRTLEELEHAVMQRIRDLRLEVSCSGDPLTVRHLAFVLEAMVWRRGVGPAAAASGRQNLLGSSDIATLLSVAGQGMAALIGDVPWGRYWGVPGGDRVVRPEIFGWLDVLLPVSALMNAGAPARAALTGFSGAGKSSATAGWVDRHQERYALVFWLSARTEDHVADAVRPLLEAEHGREVYEWDVDLVRRQFVDLLAVTPLAWLTVFDDASSPDVIREWIPSRGFGHVLITSLDATWPASSAPSLEIPAMDENTALTLVARRLGSPIDNPWAFQKLMSMTDGWPLALEMVVGWLVRSGRQLDAIASYEGREVDLLDRQNLAPDGYPRTLVSAVVSALAEIQGADSRIAWRLLLICARLGSRSVPVWLLQRLVDPNQTTEPLQIDEAVALLRAHSLVQRQSLGSQLSAEWADRITVNDLISDIAQRLADEDLDADYRADELLSNTLRTSVDMRDFRLASSLAPVVAAIQEQEVAGRRDFSLPLMALYGNMALVHESRGDLARAQSLLVREVQLGFSVAGMAGVPGEVAARVGVLALQSLIQLGSLHINNDRPDRAIEAAEMVVNRIDGLVALLPTAEWHRLVNVLIETLQTIRNGDLITRRDELLDRLSATGVHVQPTPQQQAEHALRDGDTATAHRVAEAALTTERDPLVRIHLRCAIAEAIAQDHPERADAMLKLAARDADELDAGHQFVASTANHIAVARWGAIIARGIEWVSTDRNRYQDQFVDLLPYLQAGDGTSTPWGIETRILLTHAWNAAVTSAPDSAEFIERAIAKLDSGNRHVADVEINALCNAAHNAKAVHLRSEIAQVVDARRIARVGSAVLLGLDPGDYKRVRDLGPIQSLEVTVVSWHVLLAARGATSEIVVWLDMSLVRTNTFERVQGPAHLVVLDVSRIPDESSPLVDLYDGINLGLARVVFEPWAGAVFCAQSPLMPQP